MTDEIKVMVLPTPNPMARKFVVNVDVKTTGKAAFTDPMQCRKIPLAAAIFDKPNIVQIHLFENVITVTQNGLSDWEILQSLVEKAIIENMKDHDCNFLSLEESKKKDLPKELKEIDEIMDRTVRPALQADGGDVELVKLENNILFIKFEGACGDCPSSLAGTLYAIERTVKEEYSNDVEVCVV